MSTVKRVWLYGITLVALGILIAGVRNLLALLFTLAFDSGPEVRAGLVQRGFSLALALIIIGALLWYPFWRTVQRNVAGNPAETGATLRKVFLNLVLAVSAIIVLVTGAQTLQWLLAGLPGNQAGNLAMFIANLAVWYYHWRVNEGEGHPSPAARTLRRWYVYVLAGWGLVWLSVGIVNLVYSLLVALPVWGGSLVVGDIWTPAAQRAIAWISAGGLSWAFHWFRMSGWDYDSSLRQVYLYLLAIMGGTIAGLVALVVFFYQVMLRLFGGGGPFQFLAWTIPTVIVAGAVWLYHRQVAGEEAAHVHRRRLSARRVHTYLMSFVGLGAMISGLILLLGLLIDLPLNTGEAVVTVGWWRTQLATGIALLVVATPIWLGYWNRAVTLAESGGIDEWRARSRRVYLYVVIAAAIIALAADMVNIVYQVLNGVLTGQGGEILRNSKWSLQSLVVAVPVLAYHWRIARRDQQRGAEVAAVHKSVTLMVSPATDLASRLEDKLGFKVRVLHCLAGDAILNEADLDGLVAEITAAPGDRVMVIACAGRPLVLPYREQ
ncbi:MAG: hypothetical protein HYX90_04325 [Chloroflexi bacterium]|nr:hypothetical protein [Chloroflexota bacterium]